MSAGRSSVSRAMAAAAVFFLVVGQNAYSVDANAKTVQTKLKHMTQGQLKKTCTGNGGSFEVVEDHYACTSGKEGGGVIVCNTKTCYGTTTVKDSVAPRHLQERKTVR